MRHVEPPEPYRTDIVRRLAALPRDQSDPTGWVLVWVAVFFLLWMAAGLAACIYLFREAPPT